MPDFRYIARNFSGNDIVGTMAAGSPREVMRALGSQSLVPVRVEAVRDVRAAWRGRGGRVKAQLVAATLSQLADLLHSGVPLLRSLDILAEQTVHHRLTAALTLVRDQVAEGVPLDEALARHPRIFGELTVSMVRAGLEGAFLEDALQRTASFLEQQAELRGRVIGAMTYPAILAIAGFSVTTVLIVFFVPKFAPLFERLEERGGLPWATVALLWLSDMLGRYGWALLGAAAAAVFGLRRYAATPRGQQIVDRCKLTAPLAGKVFLGYATARFCRVLGTLLRNGVPLLRSLEISSDSAGNRVLAAAVRKSAENISAGDTLSRPLSECGLISRPVMAMISVAEESNNLENVLVGIADGIERQLSRQLDLLVRMLEPLMLLVMAGVILFVLVALLLPVFEMSATMG